MIDSQFPNNWVIPVWHPDLGDAKAELEHLRTLALAICRTIPRSSVELETPEPGLMNLRITLSNGNLAEVYSLPDEFGKRRFALFLSPGMPSEKELYTSSVQEALGYLKMT